MEKHDPFTPDHIDEQIEQSLEMTGDTPEKLFLTEMQQVAQQFRAERELSLQRVEARLQARRLSLSKQLPASPVQQQQPSSLKIRREKFHPMSQKPSSSGLATVKRRVSMLVAVLITALLVGSLVVVLNLKHQQTGTGTGRVSAQSTATPRPTPAPTLAPTPTSAPTQTSFGQTLYTTLSNSFGFNGLAWSPDSQRVASATIDSVQIWDATTGNHLINVQLPGPNTYPYGIAWSPNSQLIAVATNQQLFLVDGSTGAIVHTYSAGIANSIQHTTTSNSPLSVLIPSSSGQGFRAVTWSPDGRFIAAAVSTGSNGFIQVINAQDVSPAYTLQVNGNYNPVNGLSWSSDGQYLAASSFNTEPGGATVPADQELVIWAWKLSTRQIVFQHSGGNGIGEPLAFQPGSHSLAFFSQSGLETWNVTTGQLVKHYQAEGLGTVAWSPDGKLLAFVGDIPHAGVSAQNEVSIIDANSGSLVFTYTGHHLSISQLAWSPNGKYIVSGEGQTEGDTVAKVWTA